MRRLTEASFWEEGWWQRKRPERLRLYRDLDFEMVRLLARAGGSKACRTLELGGGGSRILPYLGRKFGFRVFGSDFSWRGCLLLKANLGLQRIEGGVVCEDLFQSSLAPESFDLVYSQGLIEHFDDSAPVIIEHLRLMKPGGKLVLVVPNLEGVQGRIFARLAPPLWQVHRVFSPTELVETLSRLGLEEIRSGYLGSFNLLVGYDPRWSAFRTWPRWLWFLTHASVRLGSGLISLGFRLSPWKPHTRAWSPAFFATATKPPAPRQGRGELE
jgi:SAM-dependent methyltransferase